MFRILIHKKAFKEIESFPSEDRDRILSAIKEMANEPFGGDVKPIKNVRGVLRRRVGDYRIAFTIDFEKSEIIVFRVGRREKFY
jgi:mRNA interferase RelE/StbE